MYYPILRGRQNELLALKELLKGNALSDKIIPVIEPVKLSPTLVNSLNAFVEKHRNIILIRNLQVGSFNVDARNPKNDKYYENFKTVISNNEIIRGLIIDKSTPSKIKEWRSKGVDDSDIVAICDNPDAIKYFEAAFENKSGVKTIVPYASAFRRIRTGRILLEDKFNKKARNQDYEDDSALSQNLCKPQMCSR